MKRIFLLWIICSLSPNISLLSQEVLPKSMTKSEEAIIDTYLSKYSEKKQQIHQISQFELWQNGRKLKPLH